MPRGTARKDAQERVLTVSDKPAPSTAREAEVNRIMRNQMCQAGRRLIAGGAYPKMESVAMPVFWVGVDISRGGGFQ